jgi:hypothetical protein
MPLTGVHEGDRVAMESTRIWTDDRRCCWQGRLDQTPTRSLLKLEEEATENASYESHHGNNLLLI